MITGESVKNIKRRDCFIYNLRGKIVSLSGWEGSKCLFVLDYHNQNVKDTSNIKKTFKDKKS